MRISDWSSDVCSSDLDIALDQFGRIDLTGRHRTARIVEIGARIHDLAADADRPGVIFGEQRGAQHDEIVIPLESGAELVAEHFVPAAHAARNRQTIGIAQRSEEHTSELQSLMRNSYAVVFLNKK